MIKKQTAWFGLFLLSVILAFRALTALPVEGSAAVYVLTRHNDNQRTGANLNETVLTTSNVKPGSFGRLFNLPVDGQIYAQPLYVPGVSIPAKGVHNVVYVATQHNSVYAYDAENANQTAPLWKVNLGPSAPVPADFGSKYGPYHDIQVEVGITGTPVIDLSTGTLYVDTFIRDPNPPTCPCVYHHRLHALDITTGAEKFGAPVTIAAQVPGIATDSVNGVLSFNAHQQLQRSGLLLLNNVVYVAFTGYADTAPYHGWLLGYSANNLQQQVSVFCTTPNGHIVTSTDPNPGEGGIWMAGNGPSVDADGNIYLVTGNGTFDADTGGGDYGDTVLKLGPPPTGSKMMTVIDWYTPYNQAFLSTHNADLGSTGVLLFPNSNYLTTASKGGYMYLIDRYNLTHYNSTDMITQVFKASPSGIYSSPVFWNSPSGALVYIWSMYDAVKSFRFWGSLFDTTPTAVGSTVLSPYGFPGGTLSISANNSTPGTGILWAAHPVTDARDTSAPGVLRAYNAENVGIELWNSTLTPADNVGDFAKFDPPMIANGRVYLATASGYLAVYGLLNQPVITPTAVPDTQYPVYLPLTTRP